MYILAFETTGANASIAVIDEKGNITTQSSKDVFNHLQSAIPITKQLMKENDIQVSDISCIAASVGAGSFTGIRIGVSSARAMAQALDIPCISVPTLTSFIYNVENYKGWVCPILDARREQVYGGAFAFDESKENIHEKVEGGAYTVEEYLQKLEVEIKKEPVTEIMFFGDAVDIYKDKIVKWQNSSLNGDIRIEFACKNERLQTASSVAKLALKLYEEGKQINYEKLMPVYMRKAEAERKLEEGLLFMKRTING